MADKLKVGLVGAGFIGKMHANCWLALPNVELAAVADGRPKALKEVPGNPKTFATVDEMLDSADLDIVDVCVPTPAHADVVIEALQWGKHVLCEKPMAKSLEDCDRMIAAAEKAGTAFMVAHVIRFWPEYAYLKSVAESGKYGALKTYSCLRRMAVPMYNWQLWTHDESRAGGVPFEGQIHDVDFMRYLMGEPKSVTAVGIRNETGIAKIWGGFVYDGGRCATVEGSWGYTPEYPFQHGYVAVFEEAVLDYALHREPELRLYIPGKEMEGVKMAVSEVGKADAGGNISDLGGYFKEIEYFAGCVAKGEMPTVTTPRDARESIRVLLAEVDAMDTGGAVKL